MSTTVTNEDLTALLNILYQASVRKNPLAQPPVYKNPARFFEIEDIPIIAQEYGFPLPSAGIDATLRVGLSRGIYQRSILNGTQCGASVCEPTTSLPVLIYAYNPNMAKVNANNRQLLNPTILNFQNIQASSVKFQDNHCVCYGTRGTAYTDNNPTFMFQKNFQSTRCIGNTPVSTMARSREARSNKGSCAVLG